MNIGALPLINEVAHEWPTLLTVLHHTSRITNTVTGDNYRTIISMDMALYEKVIQIIDANEDMKAKVLPRLGELHTTKSIESSGIDDAWGEGDVFGAATTRQILGCSHYKRCVNAHVYTYAALYDLLLEQFFLQHPSMKEDLIASTCAVNDAYCKKDSADAKASLIHLREELDKTFWAAFGVWVDTKSQHAMFKSLMNYTKRIEIILEFIETTQISNLKLRIKSGEQLGKIFFGMDRLKIYAALAKVYCRH